MTEDVQLLLERRDMRIREAQGAEIQPQDYTAGYLHYIVVGSGGVGKSAAVLLFVSGRFIGEYDPTIKDQYRRSVLVSVPGQKNPIRFVLELLDTAGFDQPPDEEFISREVVVIAYSITSMASLKRAEEELERYVRLSSGLPKSLRSVCALVETKNDLEEHREVTQARGKALAAKHGVHWYSTSAKLDAGVAAMFRELAVHAYQRLLTVPKKPIGKRGMSGGRCSIA